MKKCMAAGISAAARLPAKCARTKALCATLLWIHVRGACSACFAMDLWIQRTCVRARCAGAIACARESCPRSGAQCAKVVAKNTNRTQCGRGAVEHHRWMRACAMKRCARRSADIHPYGARDGGGGVQAWKGTGKKMPVVHPEK